jgi:hypothetical protein
LGTLAKHVQDFLKENPSDTYVEEQLRFLKDTAEAKLAHFRDEIQARFLNPEAYSKIEIVGTRAFKWYDEYRVNISDGVDAAILEIVKDFFSGGDKVKEGFAKCVNVGLQGILGNAEAGQWEQHQYFIFPEHNSLVRVEVKCWRYNFTSKGIIGNVQNAFCFTVAKSVVDHTKVTVDEMVRFLSEMVGDDLTSVSDLLDKLIQVWKKIQGLNPHIVASSYQNAILNGDIYA